MKKVNVQIDIRADELKRKLNLKDGNPGKDAPPVDILSLIQQTSILVLAELQKSVKNDEPIDFLLYAQKIRDALETLIGDLRLDRSAIKGLDDYDEVSKLARKKYSTQYTGILGIKDIIAGSGITINKTNFQYPVITATASGIPVVGEVITIVGTSATLAHTPTSAGIALFLNGERLTAGVDYTLSGATITFLFTPAPNSNALADYTY